MKKNLRAPDESSLDKDGMAYFGGLLLSNHSGIKALRDYLKEKDLDNWRMIKALSTAKDYEEKDMWIYIGKSKALTEDMKVFMNRCLKLYKERDTE